MLPSIKTLAARRTHPLHPDSLRIRPSGRRSTIRAPLPRPPHAILVLKRRPLLPTPTILITILRQIREAISLNIIRMHQMLLISTRAPRLRITPTPTPSYPYRTPQTPAITPSMI